MQRYKILYVFQLIVILF